jgi:hypothetical protein
MGRVKKKLPTEATSFRLLFIDPYCALRTAPQVIQRADTGIAALSFSVESAGANWIHNKRIREHAYDYDQRRHADLL